MTNNFEQIKALLDFPNDDTFYFIQLIKRRKENPDMPKSEIVLNAHYITSIEMLERLEPEIIEFCKRFNARAYLNLNKRSFEKVGLETLRKITEYIIQKDYKAIRKAYNSCCGSYSSDPDKKWVIDVDEHPDRVSDWLMTLSADLYETQPVDVHKVKAVIPTKNGFHVITSPFNVKEFEKYYKGLDIHKNNPTLLFAS